jgi:hypothetical protein
MGLLSSVALSLPVIAILALRLATYKTFPALLFYYLIVFIYNLFTERYISADPMFVQNWGLMNNLLDAPLMLTFLLYFSTSAAFTKRLRWSIALFVLFEAIVISIVGFNIAAITIILGPGLLLTIALCTIIFIRQTKITISHKKAPGKALISTALLFAYGCYSFIYLLFYIYDSPNVEDTFLIYFLVTTFSSVLLAVGIVSEYRRICRLNELRITRKELSNVYSSDTRSVPLARKVMLDFDREEWK